MKCCLYWFDWFEVRVNKFNNNHKHSGFQAKIYLKDPLLLIYKNTGAGIGAFAFTTINNNAAQ